MDLRIGNLDMLDVERLDAEIVERKGLGHPDSICDALAEALSSALCRFYLDRFGTILHHNIDKVLLCDGESEPRFGGGRVTKPIGIFFGGRASLNVDGLVVPLEDVAVRTEDGTPGSDLHPGIEEILHEELEGMGSLADQLLSGEVALDRWPLRRA